jgi:hypothetical protein
MFGEGFTRRREGLVGRGEGEGWVGEVEAVEELSLPSWRPTATTEPPPIRTAWDVQWPLPLPVSQP